MLRQPSEECTDHDSWNRGCKDLCEGDCRLPCFSGQTMADRISLLERFLVLVKACEKLQVQP